MHTRSFLSLSVALLALFLVPNPAGAQDGAKILKSESLGSLKVGLAEKEVLKHLGKPETQGKLEKQEADGTYVQILEYPSKGLVITMTAGTKKTGPKTLAGVNASGTSQLATKLGIKVGSPAAEVRKAYGSTANKEESSDDEIVVGSRSGGILFSLEGGKVSRIFLGSAAE
jgi:hypothetical protein